MIQVLGGIYHSSFFQVLKFLLTIYVTVLFADLIMLLMLRGIRSNLRVSFKGTKMPVISAEKMKKKWAGITKLLESSEKSKWKLAVLKADYLADEILQGMELPGENMTERLLKIEPGQLEYSDEIKEAHSFRNRIIQDEKFEVEKKAAEEAVGKYEKFLKYLEYL